MKLIRVPAFLAAAFAMLMLLPWRRRRTGRSAWVPGGRRLGVVDRGGPFLPRARVLDPTAADPACRRCASPHMELKIPSDGRRPGRRRGVSVRSKRRQDDPQIVVDPVDGRTIYASYVQGPERI